MEESKISAAEIENLRELAIKEKQDRRLVHYHIAQIITQGYLPEELQMQIIKRGKKDEILALLQAFTDDETKAKMSVLLQAFTDDNAKEKMSATAQLYLYEKGNTGDNAEIYQFLLERVPYADEFVKRLIADNRFCSPQDGFCALQELSPEMQCYFLQYKLVYEASQPACAIQGISMVFKSIEQYFNKYDFCEKAEVCLLKKCLNPEPSRDSYMDGCYHLAKKYIICKKKLSLAGEKVLIASGNHDLILEYIKIAENGLKAEDELLARGNREEVTAYFERYAKL